VECQAVRSHASFDQIQDARVWIDDCQVSPARAGHGEQIALGLLSRRALGGHAGENVLSQVWPPGRRDERQSEGAEQAPSGDAPRSI
jgi:hypothetical protein